MNQKTIKLILLFSFLINFSYAQIKAANGKEISAAQMDTFLKRQIDQLAIPGMSIAFIKDGKIVLSRGFGYADLKDSVKVNSQTIFESASMSKSVFAYYTLTQVDKGVIALDTPLYRYLPYKDISYDERYKLITARMVLSHTSGFPNWREIPPNPSLKVPKGALYLNFQPGTQVSYSGEGYQYLAKVIAHRLGTDLNGLTTIINRDFLAKIGMKKSSFGWSDYVKEHKAHGFLNNGDGFNKPGEPQKFEGVNAAAGLYSNANDFIRFVILLSKGKGLKKTTYQEMLKEQSHPSETSSERDAWGLGVNIKYTDNGVRYSHSGSNSSFTTFYSLYKDKGVGYVFFINNNLASLLISKLEEFMATGKIPAESKVITVASNVLQQYTGKYEIKPGVDMIISLLNGKLFFQQSNREYKFELFARTEEEFYFKLDPAVIRFVKDSGKVVAMELQNGNGTSKFRRLD